MPLLNDVTIIKSTFNNEAGINLYDNIDNIELIKNQLYSPYKNNKIFVIDSDTINQKNKIGLERCISFDTQTISYFYRYCLGQEKSLPDNFRSVLNLLQHPTTGVSYVSYLMENTAFSKVESDIVFDNIKAFEKLYMPNYPDSYYNKKVRKIVNSYESVVQSEGFEPKYLYDFVYAILLRTCTIQITSPAASVNTKMRELCRFMDQDLCRMMFPELILAKRYFNNGQAYTFFGKIQKNKKDIIQIVKNMAWDLLHLRNLEFESNYKIKNKANVHIPYMFTYDQRLLEVKECYELDAFAVYYNTPVRVPFYSHISEIMPFIEKYLDPERVEERSRRVEKVDMRDLITNCEKKLLERSLK